jgi:hypothetical protein
VDRGGPPDFRSISPGAKECGAIRVDADGNVHRSCKPPGYDGRRQESACDLHGVKK